MILYALACDSGHRFESWFRDSAAFDDQKARGLVTCLACGSPHVAKTIMAPAVVARRTARVPAMEAATAGKPDAPKEGDAVPAGQTSVEVALVDDRQREVRALAKAFRDKVMAESQDVGASFPTQARRMHDGEIPERQIRGRATVGEARELIEDGILVLPLPNVPDEMN